MIDRMNEDSTPHKRTRLKAEDRRAQILAAAAELFGERGYWGASLQDVAHRCHFTVTGVLYHVESKENLLRMVLEASDQGFIDDVAEAMRVDASGYHLGEPVRGVPVGDLCRILMRISASNPPRTRLYSRLESESTEQNHPSHDYFLRREQRLLGTYEVTAAESVKEPKTVARMVMGLISGLRVQWLRDPDRLDLVQMWEDATREIPVLRGSTTVRPDPTVAE